MTGPSSVIQESSTVTTQFKAIRGLTPGVQYTVTVSAESSEGLGTSSSQSFTAIDGAFRFGISANIGTTTSMGSEAALPNGDTLGLFYQRTYDVNNNVSIDYFLGQSTWDLAGPTLTKLVSMPAGTASYMNFTPCGFWIESSTSVVMVSAYNGFNQVLRATKNISGAWSIAIVHTLENSYCTNAVAYGSSILISGRQRNSSSVVVPAIYRVSASTGVVEETWLDSNSGSTLLMAKSESGEVLIFGRGTLDATPPLTKASLLRWQNGASPVLVKTYVGLSDFGFNFSTAYIESFSPWGSDLLLFTADSGGGLWSARINIDGTIEQKKNLGVSVENTMLAARATPLPDGNLAIVFSTVAGSTNSGLLPLPGSQIQQNLNQSSDYGPDLGVLTLLPNLNPYSYFQIGADMAQYIKSVVPSSKGLTLIGNDNCVSGRGNAAALGTGLDSIGSIGEKFINASGKCTINGSWIANLDYQPLPSAGPSLVKATRTGGVLGLTFTPETGTTYSLESWNETGTAITSGITLNQNGTISATGLSLNQMITFLLTGTKSDGSVAKSLTTMRTLAAPMAVPGAPQNLVISNYPNAAALRWRTPSFVGSGITSYRVRLLDSNNSQVLSETTTLTMHALRNLSVGETYTVQVSAKAAEGSGAVTESSFVASSGEFIFGTSQSTGLTRLIGEVASFENGDAVGTFATITYPSYNYFTGYVAWNENGPTVTNISSLPNGSITDLVNLFTCGTHIESSTAFSWVYSNGGGSTRILRSVKAADGSWSTTNSYTSTKSDWCNSSVFKNGEYLIAGQRTLQDGTRVPFVTRVNATSGTVIQDWEDSNTGSKVHIAINSLKDVYILGLGAFEDTPNLSQSALFRWNNSGNPVVVKTYIPTTDFELDVFGYSQSIPDYLQKFGGWGSDFYILGTKWGGEGVTGQIRITRIATDGTIELQRNMDAYSDDIFNAAYLTQLPSGDVSIIYSTNQYPCLGITSTDYGSCGWRGGVLPGSGPQQSFNSNNDYGPDVGVLTLDSSFVAKSYYQIGAEMHQIVRNVSKSPKGLTLVGLDNCVTRVGNPSSLGSGLESIGQVGIRLLDGSGDCSGSTSWISNLKYDSWPKDGPELVKGNRTSSSISLTFTPQTGYTYSISASDSASATITTGVSLSQAGAISITGRPLGSLVSMILTGTKAGESTTVSSGMMTTLPSLETAPSAPRNVTISKYPRAVAVKWNLPENVGSGISSYGYLLKDSLNVVVEQESTTARLLALRDLTPGETYTLTISPSSAEGAGSASISTFVAEGGSFTFGKALNTGLTRLESALAPISNGDSIGIFNTLSYSGGAVSYDFFAGLSRWNTEGPVLERIADLPGGFISTHINSISCGAVTVNDSLVFIAMHISGTTKILKLTKASNGSWSASTFYSATGKSCRQFISSRGKLYVTGQIFGLSNTRFAYVNEINASNGLVTREWVDSNVDSSFFIAANQLNDVYVLSVGKADGAPSNATTSLFRWEIDGSQTYIKSYDAYTEFGLDLLATRSGTPIPDYIIQFIGWGNDVAFLAGLYGEERLQFVRISPNGNVSANKLTDAYIDSVFQAATLTPLPNGDVSIVYETSSYQCSNTVVGGCGWDGSSFPDSSKQQTFNVDDDYGPDVALLTYDSNLEVKSFYVIGADLAQVPKHVQLTNKGLTIAGLDNCVSGKGEATAFGLGLDSIGSVGVRLIDGTGKCTNSNGWIANVSYSTLSARNPTFGTATRTSDGFTLQISNYDSAFIWAATSSDNRATVAISGSGLITVTGLPSGVTSTVSVTTTRTGYTDGSASSSSVKSLDSDAVIDVSPDLTVATLSLFTLNGTSVLSAGSSFTVANGTTSVTVVATPTNPNATVAISGNTSLVTGNNTVEVVVTAQDATTTRSYSSTVIVSTASGRNPTFGTATRTSDGYTLQISNYDADFTWAATSSDNRAAVTISGTGLITATGLPSGVTSTVSVTTTRAGYANGSSSATVRTSETQTQPQNQPQQQEPQEVETSGSTFVPSTSPQPVVVLALPTPTPSPSPSASASPTPTPTPSPSMTLVSSALSVNSSTSSPTKATSTIKRSSASVTGAPVVLARVGATVAPRVEALPKSSNVKVTIIVDGKRTELGKLKTNSSGSVTLPGFKSTKAGIYTIQITDSKGKKYFIKMNFKASK